MLTRFPAMMLLGLALLGAPASAQPSADRERAESLPPDCLAAGAIADAGGALQRAGEILSALGGTPADGSLRTGLGSLIRNPDLVGVDLSAPVRFFYMNPQVFPRPWVYQFGVTDSEALKKALAANGPEAQEGEVALRLEGRQATWSLDAKAAESLIRWQKGGGKSPDFRAAGQFQARLDVQRLLRAFDAEFAAEVLLMKDRVRQALERGGRSGAAVEQEIAAVQAQLDSAAAALRQVRDVDFAIELDPAFVRVGLDVRLADSAPLRALFRAHAPGDLGLLGLCPPEAGLVAVNNLSFVKAAGQMFLNMAGWSSPEKSEPGAGSGHRAVALFLSQQAGETDAPTRVEILDLRDGDQAMKARQEWDRLSRQSSEPAIPDHAGGEPFSLHPVSAGEPAPGGVRLAEIEPDERTLQPEGLAAFRRFLGSRVQAAQERRGDICITAIGGSPVERVREAGALGAAEKDSLAASARFRRSIASLPEKPNLLVYVSPDALRRWFALAGRTSSEPIPADAMGLAAGLTIGGDGARFVLKFPTAGIPSAK
jgi:hypothetical protein